MAGALGRLLAWPLLLLVYAYRLLVSPWLGVNCRFQPTCSEYCIEALRTYGVFRGTRLAICRILRCHPWGGSGYDPVPGQGNQDCNQAPGASEKHDAENADKQDLDKKYLDKANDEPL